MGKHKYIIELSEKRKNIAVAEDVHCQIKLYAEEHNISISEATYILLGKALAQEEGIEPSKK